MRRYRNLIVGLAVVVIAFVATFLAVSWWRYFAAPAPGAAAPQAQTAQAPSGGRPREEVIIRRPSLKHTEGGRLAWQVRLRELKVAAGGQAVAAAGMREALIYDQTGAPVIRLAAREARGNTSERNLEVSGDVRAVSAQGAIITTDKVRWLEQERRLLCPGKVTMRSRNVAVTTNGLNYFVDADTIKCPNPVRMYSGQNKLIGRQLVYNVKTEAFEMKNVQAIFNPEQAKALAKTR
ncbi:MAG: LPS export ABC transporter periplasmic protein LptC [Armatimonadia bacterium]